MHTIPTHPPTPPPSSLVIIIIVIDSAYVTDIIIAIIRTIDFVLVSVINSFRSICNVIIANSRVSIKISFSNLYSVM